MLIGDGWVKDGDFNTAYSLYLHKSLADPFHALVIYARTLLEDDPDEQWNSAKTGGALT